MDLLQLRYFQAVARHQHVSRAAAELRVAQPALSRAIARLEAELGVPLFDRRGRRVRLNRFGAMFLARAGRALDELDQGQREVRDTAGLAQGTVAVAAETLRTLSGLVAGFLAGHPGVSFRLFQSPAPAMAAQLQAGEVDLCLASQPLPGPALASAELLSEEVLLAVPPSHRLAGRTRATVGELTGEPFVTTRRGYWQRALTDRDGVGYRDPGSAEHGLGGQLVEREPARVEARARVRHPEQLQQGGHGAVLTEPAVEGEEGGVEVPGLERLDQVLVGIELGDPIALLVERLGHPPAGPERDLPLE